jgi:hypothetical protein
LNRVGVSETVVDEFVNREQRAQNAKPEQPGQKDLIQPAHEVFDGIAAIDTLPQEKARDEKEANGSELKHRDDCDAEVRRRRFGKCKFVGTVNGDDRQHEPEPHVVDEQMVPLAGCGLESRGGDAAVRRSGGAIGIA